ncbi:hypothetical protein GCM10022236_41470 [Microlunatus ginsengisoli]|uniref:Uncharacterized protein n=1 Tax=Microlunatus ginsengisoli TaxID=363863 RepID=A0ABP7AKK2_9ACTN
MARIAALLAASVALAVGLLLAFPAAAEARPADAGADTLSVCEQLSFNGNTSSLPAMRWDDASTHLHSRLGGAVWDDVPQKLQRNGYTEQLLAIGNFFWSSAAGFTEKASRFCPLDTAGGVIDRAAGRVGTAIMESSVPPLAILLAVVGFLWRKRRNGGSPRQLFGTVVIVALMGMMVGGATRSTGGGLDGGDFTPGTLSPGWFVTRTDMITSALAAKPAQVLGAVELDDPAGGARDRLSCYAYTTAMKDQYKQLWGSGGPAGTKAASSVPLVISGMWEQSGMVAWRKAQFGGNSYGDYMSCRLLESFAGTPFAASPAAVPGPSESSIRAYMIRAGIPAAQLHAGALAWRPANDPVERDRQMIGWAACRAKDGDLNSGFAFSSPYFVDDSHRDDADALCGRFFTDPDWDGDEFDAPVDTADVIRQAGKDPAVVQFINVLHGKDSAGGPVAAFAYALSGVSVFAVFGLVSLAVIVAKLAALALMLTLFAAMTVALFTRDGLDRVFRFAKQYIGLSFYVFASSLVMAVLALITKVCMSIGGSLLAEGGLMATMWAGLSPLLALSCWLPCSRRPASPHRSHSREASPGVLRPAVPGRRPR